MENLITYCLEYSTDGTLVDGVSYSSLDQARDVAVSTVQQDKSDVKIFQSFGFSRCLWEEYDYATYG